MLGLKLVPVSKRNQGPQNKTMLSIDIFVAGMCADMPNMLVGNCKQWW